MKTNDKQDNWLLVAGLDLGCLLVIICMSLLIGFEAVLRILGDIALIIGFSLSKRTAYHPLYYVIVGTMLLVFSSLLIGSVGPR